MILNDTVEEFADMELDKEAVAPAENEFSDVLYCNKIPAQSLWHGHTRRRDENPKEADSTIQQVLI